MSSSLLKRSLDIVGENFPNTNRNNKFRTQKSSADSKIKSGSIINRSSTDAWKKTGGKQTQKLTIDDIKARNLSKKEQETKNLRKLLLLSSKKPKLDNMSTEKIFQRARTNRYVLDVEKKPEINQESIFTDEDFEKFEKEYFS